MSTQPRAENTAIVATAGSEPGATTPAAVPATTAATSASPVPACTRARAA
ncbi:hypothetical protein [Cellulomonas sp. H30R-01]|nr:hypothetical protein [Cellulomonas sp. H30R-01]